MTELLTQDQVAELLGVTPGTLANWRSSGNGPRYVKPVGKVRYRKSDVEAFIDAGVVTSTSAAVRGTALTAEQIAARKTKKTVVAA